MIDLVAKTIIPGHQGTYRHLTTRVFPLFADSGQTLVHGTSWDAEDHTQGLVAQPYGGYLVPGSTLQDLHLIVSQWNTTTNWPYHAMQFHANITQ